MKIMLQMKIYISENKVAKENNKIINENEIKNENKIISSFISLFKFLTKNILLISQVPSHIKKCALNSLWFHHSNVS